MASKEMIKQDIQLSVTQNIVCNEPSRKMELESLYQ